MATKAPGRLQDKVAVVTGGASGIGRAIALAYALEGAKVVVGDLEPISKNTTQHQATHELITSKDGEAIFVELDVQKSASVNALIDRAVEKFGRLDVMVNNAGVAPEGKVAAAIWEKTDQVWDLTLGVNGTGVFYGVRAAAAQMVKQEPLASGDRGWIINLASILGQVGAPGSAAYVSSKHLVMGLTKAAALDCAPMRIHVNAICPGYTHSVMTASLLATESDTRKMLEAAHPFRGLGEPEDIARVAVMLASDDARWMTGTAVTVDGGFVAQ